MQRAEAIATALSTVQERWGPHSLTRGWSGRSRAAVRHGWERPSWWPGASSLPRPTVLELAGAPSCGKLSLAMLWLAAADRGGLIAVVDEAHTFYPPAAVACGLDLGRLVVVRPPAARAAMDAAGLLLASEGFDAVLWPVGARTRPNGATAARLAAQAAHANTTLLTLLTRSGLSRSGADGRRLVSTELGPSCVPADVRLSIARHEWLWHDGVLAGSRLLVQAARVRGGAPERDWELTLTGAPLGPSPRVDGDGRAAGGVRLAAAVPAGGGAAAEAGRGGEAAGDLRAQRALASAG
ncbi:MAG: hypothetical protein U0821_21335 [Chloroflexota bacterium]